jgi:general secretion pathway protein G
MSRSPPDHSSATPIQFSLTALFTIIAGFGALFTLVAALRGIGFLLAVLVVGVLALVRTGSGRAKVAVLKGQAILVTALLSMCVLTGLLSQALIPSAAARTQDVIAWMEPSLTRYRLNVGQFPSTQQGLKALVRRPAALSSDEGWAGPYLPGSAPNDAWGRPLAYRSPGEHNRDSYDLWSTGPDGIDATGDEIGNW